MSAIAGGIIEAVIFFIILGTIVWLICAFFGVIYAVTWSGDPHPRQMSVKWNGIITAVMLVLVFFLAFFGDRLLNQ